MRQVVEVFLRFLRCFVCSCAFDEPFVMIMPFFNVDTAAAHSIAATIDHDNRPGLAFSWTITSLSGHGFGPTLLTATDLVMDATKFVPFECRTFCKTLGQQPSSASPKPGASRAAHAREEWGGGPT